MNPYKDYLITRCGYGTPIELDGGFLFYVIRGDECHISEIYTPVDARQNGIATRMADMCTEIALRASCRWLTCTTKLNGMDDELGMLSILHYGFKPVKADQNVITYAKSIGGR